MRLNEDFRKEVFDLLIICSPCYIQKQAAYMLTCFGRVRKGLQIVGYGNNNSVHDNFLKEYPKLESGVHPHTSLLSFKLLFWFL